jgi:polysaccharide pyruvyl transferase WcaK-like protein
MPPVEIEPTISAGYQPKNYAYAKRFGLSGYHQVETRNMEINVNLHLRKKFRNNMP